MSTDWRFTEDGDLELGSPKTNQEGELLFLHKDGTVDTNKGEDGKEVRDISLSLGMQTDKQMIFSRLQTDNPDWFHHPEIGANLSDIVGEPNTRETGALGAAAIQRALTHKNLYHQSEVSVRPVPISASEILFLIMIEKMGRKPHQVPVVFNLEHGLLSEYQNPE